jgi:putative methanogenesis marker protein 8
MDEHVIEAMGKTRIVVKDGKVVEVGEPQIKYCPLFHKYRGIEELDSESIKKNIEFRISDFGMCTPQRELKMKDFLSFGISETISTLLDEKVIDCAIMVCEGAGTILVQKGEIAQGAGGRISGFISTTPIPEIIETLGEENVLDPETAHIDQVQGVQKAIDMGYKEIAVTLVSPYDAAKIREIEKNNEKVNIYIFAVHVTGQSPYEAQELFEYSDVLTACASHTIREIGEKSALLKVGASIPIYAATKIGKEFLLMRIEKIGGIKDKKDARQPEPLI